MPFAGVLSEGEVKEAFTAEGVEFDLVVVGGGIYGVMLALEAGRRGQRALLLEKDDFGGATTYNSATRTVLINQIYFTSVQILPAFLLVSAFFGSLFIGVVFQVLKDLGLVALLGNVLMGLIVTELSPFFTVLLITLRSGAAINAEMAAMQVNREIKALETFRIDIIDYLLAPRVVSGVISVVLLSFLFSIVLMTSGILFSRVIFDISADAAGMLIPGGSIAIKLVKAVVDRTAKS